MIPPFLYGTAWKEGLTQELVAHALQAGFTGIDTANQRKHYYEEGVGLGIQQFLNKSPMQREDLFIQTKFTFAAGQDERKPYNDQDPFKNQVTQSFASSLKHLQTEYIDSYVLHGPYYSKGLSPTDWEVWEAMEQLVHESRVKFLGISNVSISQLVELYKEVSIKPTFVQNRCFAFNQWDQEIRDFCAEHELVYQGFSLLTANHPYLSLPLIQSLATKYKKSIPQIIFRFAKDIGILPLTGTTNPQHMDEDLHLDDFHLTIEERRQIELISLYR
ncbi:aldo/keto reductase family protein [Legionella antarctica]|nr:aldo/keto reductase [Legionella antarctica]